MSNDSSQFFESYVPVYDTVPEKWDDARPFLVEQLKKMSNAINVREIGWLLDEELLSGQQFFPGTSNNQAFRTVLRVVVDFSPLGIGTTAKPHGVKVNESFRLIELWGAATDAVGFTGNPINQPNITYDVTNINITSAQSYTFCQAVMLYIQEL